MKTQFNPSRLSSGRISRGLTIKDLAEQIGISKQAVSQFELGQAVPKAETLMMIVNKLDFPKSYFFEVEEEQYVGNTFFRASATITKRTREMQKERAKWTSKIYNVLNEYVEFPSSNIPDLLHLSEEEWNTEKIEELAITVRNHWKLGDKPILNLVNVLESNGIIVASVELKTTKVDAFCQPRSGRSFIILGEDKRSASRRHFDAAHELGHLLMHLDIHNQDSLTRDEFKTMEQQANQFASAFLLPEEAFASMVSSETTLDGYVELKKYWRVSIAAMIHRAKDLGIISLSRYTSLQKQISMRKMRAKEPLDDILPIPYPTLFKKAFEAIIQSGVDIYELVNKQMCLNAKDVETICDLPSGTLFVNKDNLVLRLRDNSPSMGIIK